MTHNLVFFLLLQTQYMREQFYIMYLLRAMNASNTYMTYYTVVEEFRRSFDFGSQFLSNFIQYLSVQKAMSWATSSYIILTALIIVKIVCLYIAYHFESIPNVVEKH